MNSNRFKFRGYSKEKGMIYFSFNDLTYYCESEFQTEYRDNDKFQIMQFTGLQDKNGKDIYEGDIVKLCGESIIQCGNDVFVVKYEGNKFTPDDIKEKTQVDIIGNMYEHSELIKPINKIKYC